MIKKIIKLFGIKVWETDIYESDDAKPTLGKPKFDGGIIDYTPEEESKDNGYKTSRTTN